MNDTGEKKILSLGNSGARPANMKPGLATARTKTVVVETRTGKRVIATPPAKSPAPMAGARPATSAVPPRASVTLDEPTTRRAAISDAELERRAKALAAARARDADEADKRAAEEAAREEERQRRRMEIEAREQEEAARVEEARLRAEDEVRKREAAA